MLLKIFLFLLEHTLSTCENNISISCQPYNKSGTFPTVIEVRSVFYGRTTTSICPVGATGTNCTSLDTSKKHVMKACQGKNHCVIDDLTKHLQDPCASNTKYFNMTYRCQPGNEGVIVSVRPGFRIYTSILTFLHKRITKFTKTLKRIRAY